MRKAVVLAFAFLVAAGLALAQDKTPNLSGTWVLDKTKSDAMGGPGGGGQMPDVTLVIDHQGTTLKIKRTTKTDQGDRVQEVVYTTDGTENKNPGGGRGGESKTKSTWEGGKLMTKGTVSFQMQDGTTNESPFSEVRSLSEDGKTLTIETTRTFRGEQRTTKQVFVKQG